MSSGNGLISSILLNKYLFNCLTHLYYKFVHWPLIGELLRLVQRGGNWAGCPCLRPIFAIHTWRASVPTCAPLAEHVLWSLYAPVCPSVCVQDNPRTSRRTSTKRRRRGQGVTLEKWLNFGLVRSDSGRGCRITFSLSLELQEAFLRQFQTFLIQRSADFYQACRDDLHRQADISIIHFRVVPDPI